MARDTDSATRIAAAERARWMQVCRRRADMWRRTAEKSAGGPMHEEARARANEAEFIADLIASGEAGMDVVH